MALTSVVVKVLERLTVLTHLKYVTNSNTDPLQFTYMDNRYTDDAGALALHFFMQHVESPNILYARILFVDYINARVLFVDLQFRVRHGHPTETLWQAASAITRCIDVLLDSWLPSAAAQGCKNERHCVQHCHTEQWNSPGMCPFPASLLPVHKWLCIQYSSVKLVKFADATILGGLWPVAWPPPKSKCRLS